MMTMTTYHFKLYGVEAVSTTIRGEPLFNKKALERFCNNNNFKYPFGEENPPINASTIDLAYTVPINHSANEDEIEVIEGVTVGDIRKMSEGNIALSDVLKVVKDWRNLPLDRNKGMALVCSLNRKAKENSWGGDTDYRLSKNQYEIIGDIFIQSKRKLSGKKEARLFPKFEEVKSYICSN